MTNHDKTKVLAEKVMGWTLSIDRIYWCDDSGIKRDRVQWDPFTNRNALADVIGKLDGEQWHGVFNRLVDLESGSTSHIVYELMTCGPCFIADAVYEVVAGAHSSTR